MQRNLAPSVPPGSATVSAAVARRSPDRRALLPGRALPWTLGVATAACLVVGVAIRPSHRAHADVSDEPKIRADKEGVTLTEGASQWEYVKLSVAQQGAALAPLPVPGRVDFDELRTARIGVPLGGRIEQVLVRLGDAVKPGDRLFSVRSREFADVDKDLATARESVEVKRRLRDRARDLFGLNAVPEKDLLAAEAELREAGLALKAAEAKQRSLAVAAGGDNLFWVRAPRAGLVVSLDAFASQSVTPDRAEPLMRISDTTEVLMTADVPETDAADLAAGGEAVVRTREGLERKGTIQHIASVVDPQRQTLGVRIHVDNADGALKPNSFVDVTLVPRGAVRPVVIDEDAIVTDGSRSTVFVLKEANRPVKQAVQPGRRRDGVVEIRSGLEAGTRYVAKGALLLLNQIDLAD